MSRRVRWLVTALVVVVVAAVGIVTAWPTAERFAREQLIAALSDATGLPATVDQFALSLIPPRLQVAALTVGDRDSPALRATGIDVQLDPSRSLSAGRPMLRGVVGGLDVDANRWPRAQQEQPQGPASIGWLPGGELEVGELHVSVPIEEQPLRVETRTVHVGLTPGIAGLAVAINGGAVGVTRGDQSLRVDEWRVEGDVRPAGPSLRTLLLHSDLTKIEAKVTSPTTVALHAEADIGRLWAWLGQPGTAQGTLRLDGSMHPDLSRPDLEATVTIEAPSYNELRVDRVAGSLLFDGQTVTLRSAAIELPDLSVGGDGYVSVAPPHEFGVWLNLPSSEVNALAAAAGGPPLAGRAEASLELQGALVPLVADGYVTATAHDLRPVAGDMKGLDANLDARLETTSGVSAVDGRLQVGSAANATVSARVGREQELSGQTQLEVRDAGVLRAFGADVRGGSGTVHAVLGGSLTDPQLTGAIDARGIVVAGSRIDGMRGGFAATGSHLTLTGVQVDAVGGQARVDGDVAIAPDATNAWRASLQDVDLETAWQTLHSVGIETPYVAGKLSGTASASGIWSALRLDTHLTAVPLTVTTERAASATVDAHSDGESWRATLELVRGPDESIAVEGTGTGTRSLALKLRSTPWSLRAFHFIPAGLEPLDGTMSVSASISGSLANPQGEADLVLHDGVVRGYGVEEVRVHAASQSGGWQLRLNAPAANVSADASVRNAPGFPFTLTADLHDSEFTAEAHEQPLQLTLGGSVSASGLLSQLGALSGRLELRRFDIVRGGHRWDIAQPIVLRGERGHFQIQSAELVGEFGSVHAGGSISFDGEADLEVTADTNAEVLELIGPPFTSARGKVNIRAHIAHSRAQAWNLRGRAQVEGLALDIGLPFVLTDVDGAFDLEGAQIVLDDVHGHAGGGEFSLTGAADLANGPRVHFVAKEMSSGFLDWLEDRVSGTGSIQGTWDNIEVVGEVTVLNAVYDRSTQLAELLPWFREQVTPRVHPPKEKAIRLDLRIRANDSVYIDTNYAKAELRGAFRITGTDIKPLLKGRVEVIDGEVIVLDRRFTVTDGEVAFGGTEEINPTLNFTATSSVTTPDSEFQVTAQVVGTLQDYRVLLFSDDPSMTTTDVAMLLATGRTPAQRQREGGNASAGGVVEFAPAIYGDTLQKGVTQFIPLDRFEVDPVYSRSTGNIEPRLTIGKDLANGLRALASSTFGVDRRNAVSLEYRLTPTIVLQGSWESQTTDQAGGFGGDIKFRHEFRHLPRFTLWPRSPDGETR